MYNNEVWKEKIKEAAHSAGFIISFAASHTDSITFSGRETVQGYEISEETLKSLLSNEIDDNTEN